jgi:ribosome-binding protein aMBF1 (putative translation factor)
MDALSNTNTETDADRCEFCGASEATERHGEAEYQGRIVLVCASCLEAGALDR